MEGIEEKRCRDCGETKPIVEFWKWKGSKDGHALYCRDCFGFRNAATIARRRERQGLPPLVPRAKPPEVPEGLKWCRDCAEIKPLEMFVLSKKSPTGRGSYCKPCQNARGEESRQRLHGGSREYHLRRRYGIGVKVFEAILAEQDGKCLICERPDPEHVDHDHQTGKVRGILCFNCNQGLGNFRDDIRSLIRAVNYLMRGSSWKGKGLDGFQGTRPGLAAA